MKTWIKIVIGIVVLIVVVGIILSIVISLKEKNDIKDMKSGFSKILQSTGIDKDKADTKASCYIDKMVKEFGYLKTKEIYNGEINASDSEAEKMAEFLKDC